MRLRDLDTGNILFETENQGAFVSSSKRYYVRFRVEVWERRRRLCLRTTTTRPAARC